MANDLRVDLKLGTEDYDRNLRKSKKQIDDWKTDMNKISTEITKGFGMVATAFLGAQGAAEVFNKTVNATQATGDAYQKMVDQMTASSDLFFASLAQADFSLFISGLKTAIDEAGKLSVLLDNLGTNKLFSMPEIARIDKEIAVLTMKVKDKSLSKEDREQAASGIEELQSKKREIKELTISQTLSAGYQSFKSGIANVGYDRAGALSNYAIDQLMKNLRLGLAGDIGAEYKRMKDAQTELVELAKGGYATIENPFKVAEFKEYMKTDKGQWAQANYYANQASDSHDSEFAQGVNLISEADNAKAQLITEETAQLVQKNRIAGSGNSSTATTKKGKVTVDVTVDSDTEDVYDMDLLTNRWEGQQSTAADRRKNSASQALLKSDAFSQLSSLDLLPKEEDINFKTNIDNFNQMALAISSVTAALNAGNDSWLSYISNVVSSITAAIPAFDTLANAQGKAAVTGAAASVSSIPVVGWVMAGAAALSVTASLSNLPRFAEGGIVGGPTFSGDKLPALLNAGEMVLNTRQQAALFNRLDSAHASRANEMSRVEFRISGDDLVGLINKTLRQRERT